MHNQAGQSFISYITAKVLDSIQVSIRDFHIQYRENLFVSAQVLSGVKFSSLTIRQNPVGSYATKVIGGQVNKIVDIEGLAIYCHTFEAISSTSSFDAMKAEFCSSPRWEGKDFDHLLQPLDVSVSIMINKLGKLDGKVPQFSIRAELSGLVLSLNEVQLQQVLMLMDYLNTSRLREKYGRYRPRGISLSRKQDGWQRSWWQYAQMSIRSDVHKKLKKTSWRYLGQRLSSRHKYIRLYKKKLDFLQKEQPIDKDILGELEVIEKESDVNAILSYRSAAESELQEMSSNSSFSNKEVTSVGSSVEKTQSDGRSLNRPRGWLNWLSRGMLGAGGTDDSGQFSGVISDEVVKDIYEATKFHPLVLSGSADANEKLFTCAITFSIAQITATLRGKKSIEGIGNLIFKDAKVECKLGKELDTIVCFAKMAEIVNPCSGKVILQTGVFSTAKIMEANEQSACTVQLDVSKEQELDLSAMLQPVEVTLDMDFFANIMEFFSVLKSCKSQPERVLLSLNGIKDLKTRLSSKAESILSSRKKISWNINFRNVVVNIAHVKPVPCQRNLVLMAGSFLCTSKVDVVDCRIQQQSYVLTELFGSSGDSLGFTIEDLYNLFDISLIDVKVKLLASEHAPSVTIVENFCPSITFASCIISDESILKQLEVSIIISSVSAKFSPSIFRSVIAVIAYVDSLYSNSGSLSLINLHTSSAAPSAPWASYFGSTVAASIHSGMVYLDFENESENSSKLSLSLQELYMRYSHMEIDECQVSLKELNCTSIPLVDGHDGLILCSSKNQFSLPSKAQKNFCRESIDEGDSGLDEVCLLIKYEACQNVDSTFSCCKLDLNDVDLHCHPHIIGLFRGLIGRISGDDASNKVTVPVYDYIQPRKPGLELQNFGVSNFYESSSLWDDGIPLDFYPFITISNNGHIGSLEKSLRYPCSNWRDLFSVRNERPKNLKSNWKKGFDSFSAVKDNFSSGVSFHKNTFNINIILSGIRVFFHDSACVVGTLLIPTAASSVLVQEDSMDVLCSTEGLILTSSLWTRMFPEFLWGPTLPNISPILNVRFRKGLARSLNSKVEVSIGVQHINCVLPAEYLAILIGYFSLPDWDEKPLTQSPVGNGSPVENGSPVVYKFEILDSTLMLPVDQHDNQFLKMEFKQLYSSFVHNCALAEELENIYPSYILSDAHKIPSRNHFLSIFGRDLYLSLVQYMDEGGSVVLGQDTRCKDICLLAPLNADIWVRIPNGSEMESETTCSSTSIMAGIRNCQLVLDGCSDLNEFGALLVVVDQFSSISKDAKTFTSVPHFLQLRRGFPVEETVECSLDITTNTAFTELRFSVESLSVTFLGPKPNLTSLEQLAKADMQFVCTASLVDDVLMDLDFSLASLLISSSLNPVILAQCTKTSSTSAFQICLRKVGGDSLLDISLPDLDVWLHLFDWFRVIDICSSCAGRVSQCASGNCSSVASPKSTVAGNGKSEPTISLQSEYAVQDSSSLVVKSENIGLKIYFPVNQFEEKANAQGQTYPYVSCRASERKHHEYIVVTTLSRSFELHMVGLLAKLTCTLERTSGAVGISHGENIITWPLFQISQVFVVAKIGKGQTTDLNLGVECHHLDVCLSHQVLCFLHDARFDIPEGGPSSSSSSSLGCIDLKIQTRKISLLISDERWSFGGPLLEILMKGLLLRTTITEKIMESSVESVLEVKYNNIHKVLWESFIEPWSLEIKFVRKYDTTPLLSSSVVTDVNLASSAQLNLNITESLIECVCMTAEMLKDAWQSDAVSEGCRFPGPQPTSNMYEGRYAPYLLENLTSLPLIYYVFQGLGINDVSDASMMKDGKSVQPGACIPIYVNETPEEQLFRYRPAQSSDRLSDRQSSGVVHHFMCVQLDGTSQPSVPISMDLVGLTYFEVDFSKTTSKIESERIMDAPNSKFDDNARASAKHGFVLPVVFDVSVKRYSKMIRLYSTVILSNATSVPLELRFDIPFGLAPKILDPIYPGQEFPLPLHLAEAGRMRWRPIGDTLLWSEVHELSNVISQESKIGSLRSSVCYPSTPSSDPFRCCISVRHFRLPSATLPWKGSPVHAVSTSRQSAESNSQVRESTKRFVHQVILGTPITVNNYLPDEVSLTIESGGISCVVPLTEEKTSFHHVDPSHDVGMELYLDGFQASSLKFPSVEAFSVTSKFSGTKFSSTETLAFVPDSSKGPVHVSVEKIVDAFSGQREVFIFSTFLLYNCTGLLLNVMEANTEGIGNCCTLPSYIKSSDLSEHEVLHGQRKGLGLLSADHDSHIKYQNIEGGRSPLMTNQLFMHVNDANSHFRTNTEENLSSGSQGRSSEQSRKHELSEQNAYLSSGSASNVLDPTDVKFGRVKACMFSPLSTSSVSEVMVKVSMYLPEDVTGSIPNSSWSEPFLLVPPSGSSTVLIPRVSSSAVHVISVSSSSLTGPLTGRSQAITFQPRYVISNACRRPICYKQKGTDTFHQLDIGQHACLDWTDKTRELLVSVRFNEPGWEWSGGFMPDHLGDTQVKTRNYTSGELQMVRVEVRNADVSIGDEKIIGSLRGNSGTNLVLLSDDDSGFMPYRIDNFSKERLRVYQQRCETFDTMVHPYATCPYAWDEPCYPHRLAIEVPGERVVGLYTLDVIKEHAAVHIKATSEKPERTLLVSVRAEGATKVLSIVDSSYHVLKDLEDPSPTTWFQQNSEQKPEIYVDYEEKLSLSISHIGISLINGDPQELLFACAKNISLQLLQSLDQQKISFQVSSLQIDNQLSTTPYPVILSFNQENRSSAASQRAKDDSARSISDRGSQIVSNPFQSVLHLAVATWRKKDNSLLSFECISLRVADFRLELEQEVILSLIDFFKAVSAGSRSKQLPFSDPSHVPLLYDTDNKRRWSDDYVISRQEKNHVKHLAIKKSNIGYGSLPSVVPIGAPWQKIFRLAGKQKKIYVEVFDLSPIKFTLSFSSSPWILRNGILTSGESLIHKRLMAVADVEGARINLKQLTIAHQMASLESMRDIIIRHYTRQLLHEIYKVFGSAGVIGNPMGVARSLGLGVRDFLSVPAKGVLQSPSGLITGMAQGTGSLVSNTVYALSDAATQFSKAAHKGIVAFTFDDQAVARMEKQQKGAPPQSKGVISEVLEGLTGLLQYPIKEAEKHGLPGVFSGLALGITGLVAKPAASLLEVTGKTAQSIRNRSRLYHQRYRVRFPRPLSPQLPLRPYCMEEAIGTSVLSGADDSMKLKDEVLVVCRPLREAGKFVILTERLVLKVYSSSLVDLGKPDFQGVPMDPDWLVESEIGLDSVIHADTVDGVVHIVGSSSDALVRQNQQQSKRGSDSKARRQWTNPSTPLPLFQTNLELHSVNDAEDLLRVLMSTIEEAKGKKQGCGYVLHRSNMI
ncbi:Intermembrane lipid transfer protein vps13A [Linum perenne]